MSTVSLMGQHLLLWGQQHQKIKQTLDGPLLKPNSQTEEPCFPSDLEVWPLKLYTFHDVELPGPSNAQAPLVAPHDGWEWEMDIWRGLNIGTRKIRHGYIG